jgi:hypothetical protein
MHGDDAHVLSDEGQSYQHYMRVHALVCAAQVGVGNVMILVAKRLAVQLPRRDRLRKTKLKP